MCEDVPSPESSRPENGQCEWCHCLGNTKCSQCGKCKSCGKPVPFEVLSVVPYVPSPWPVGPLPYPPYPWSPIWGSTSGNSNVKDDGHVIFVWNRDEQPNVNGGNYTTFSVQI